MGITSLRRHRAEAARLPTYSATISTEKHLAALAEAKAVSDVRVSELEAELEARDERIAALEAELATATEPDQEPEATPKASRKKR